MNDRPCWRRPAGLLTFVFLIFAWTPVRADSICAPWPDGTACYPENICLGRGSCQAGNCVSTMMLPSGTVCRRSVDPCKGDDTCDGMGSCSAGPLRPVGTVCASSPDPCQGGHVCDAMGQCVAGAKLPTGTICAISTNSCRDNSLCDSMGLCIAGPALPSGTICLDATACRDEGTCDGAGGCRGGTAVNEGAPCVGTNACVDSKCAAGVCQLSAPRDCSGGDPCRKKNACDPVTGCLVVNICDMLPPPDLMRDMTAVDMAGPDQRMPPPDLRTDSRTPDQDLGQPDAARPGAREFDFTLPFQLTGGACQCQIGGQAGSSPPLLLLVPLCGVLWLRRRRRR